MSKKDDYGYHIAGPNTWSCHKQLHELISDLTGQQGRLLPDVAVALGLIVGQLMEKTDLAEDFLSIGQKLWERSARLQKEDAAHGVIESVMMHLMPPQEPPSGMGGMVS